MDMELPCKSRLADRSGRPLRIGKLGRESLGSVLFASTLQQAGCIKWRDGVDPVRIKVDDTSAFSRRLLWDHFQLSFHHTLTNMHPFHPTSAIIY
eukprot:1131408-Pelagomonas_calceolata.AAC.4